MIWSTTHTLVRVNRSVCFDQYSANSAASETFDPLHFPTICC
jgi:hypothetical protein